MKKFYLLLVVLICAFTASATDYSSWYLKVPGGHNNWDQYNGTPFSADGIATFTNQKIGTNEFKILIWNGSDNVWRSNNNKNIAQGQWVDVGENDWGNMKIADASNDQYFDVQYNCATHQLRVYPTGTNPDAQPDPEPETYYYRLHGAIFADYDGWTDRYFTVEDGKYLMNNVELKAGDFGIERWTNADFTGDKTWFAANNSNQTVTIGSPFQLQGDDNGKVNAKLAQGGTYNVTWDPETSQILFEAVVAPAPEAIEFIIVGDNYGGWNSIQTDDAWRKFACSEWDAANECYTYTLTVSKLEGAFKIKENTDTWNGSDWAGVIVGATNGYSIINNDMQAAALGTSSSNFSGNNKENVTITMVYYPNANRANVMFSWEESETPTPGVEYVNWWFSGDMNRWSDAGSRAGNQIVIKDGDSNEIQNDIWGEGNAPYYLTRDEMQDWRFKKVVLDNEKAEVADKLKEVSETGWIKLDMRNLADGNGHKGRLCGQFQILSGSIENNDTRFCLNDNNGEFKNRVIAPNTMFAVDQNGGGKNFHKNCNYIENAVIYLNTDKKQLYITGTGKDIYFYYTNRKHTSAKPTSLNFQQFRSQYNYDVFDTDNVTVANMEQVQSATYVTGTGRKIALDNVWRVKLPNSSEHRFPTYFQIKATGNAEGNVVADAPIVVNDPIYIRTSDNWGNAIEMSSTQEGIFTYVLPKGKLFLIDENNGGWDWNAEHQQSCVGLEKNYFQNDGNWIIKNDNISSLNDREVWKDNAKVFELSNNDLDDGDYLIQINRSGEDNNYSYRLTVSKYVASQQEPTTNEKTVDKTIACDDVWLIEGNEVNVYFRYANETGHENENVSFNAYYNVYDENSGAVSNRVYMNGNADSYTALTYREVTADEVNDGFAPLDAKNHKWYCSAPVEGAWSLVGNALFRTADGTVYPLNGVNASEDEILKAAINGFDLWYVVPRTIEAHLLFSHMKGSYVLGSEMAESPLQIQGEVWVNGEVDNTWNSKYHYDFKVEKDGEVIFDDDDIWVPYMVNSTKQEPQNVEWHEPYPWYPTEAGNYKVTLNVTDVNTGAQDTDVETFPVYAAGEAPAKHTFWIDLAYDKETRMLKASHNCPDDSEPIYSWVKWASSTNDKYGDDSHMNENNSTAHRCDNFGEAYYRIYAEAVCTHDIHTAAVQGWENADTRVARTMYVEDNTTGIEAILAEKAGNDSTAPVEYYNLQGVRLHNPAPGQIIIVRQGTKATKIRF